MIAIRHGIAIIRRSPVSPPQHLARNQIKVADLMSQWDPNGDGSISKMEFRVDVRKILDKANVKEVDALFSERVPRDSNPQGSFSHLSLHVSCIAAVAA